MKNPHSGKAHEFIRKKILLGEFGPGYRLKNQELTALTGLSATPIRDALRQLENEGLVEILPRFGASVKALDLVAFKELSEVRCALECLAAELAAINRTEVELRQIESSLNEMEKIVTNTSQPLDEVARDALRTADIHFHVGILAAAHNQTLYTEVLRLQVIHRINAPMARKGTVAPSENPVAWQNSVFECHQRIFFGIRDRNPEAARHAMKEHIQGIVDRAVLALAKSLEGRNLSRITSDQIGYLE